MADKLFFFWSQEWRRITRAPASLTATVPDPTWLTDPTSTNYVAPANRDPNAVRLLAAYPAPNVAGSNQYLVSSPNINNTRQEVVRLDYDLSDRWRLTTRYTHDLSETREIGGLFQGFAVPNVATTDTAVPGHVFSVGLKTIFSGSMLNELSVQRSGNRIGTTNPDGTRGRREDYNLNIPEVFAENASGRIPSIAISSLSSIGSAQLIGIEYINHTITDNFTMQRGNRALKAGVLLTFEQKNENAANGTQGSFSFTGTLLNYTTGDPLVGLIIAGRNSPYGRGSYEFKKNSIQPRIGFTLDPSNNGDTIVRGAYGIYYDQPLVGIFEQNAFTIAATAPSPCERPPPSAVVAARTDVAEFDHRIPEHLACDADVPVPRTAHGIPLERGQRRDPDGELHAQPVPDRCEQRP